MRLTLAERQRRKRRSPGQSLVEFALLITLFVFLAMGVFEFGHLLLSYTMMAAGAREAARYGTASGVTSRGLPHYADCEGIRQAALRLGRFGGVGPSDVQIAYDRGPGTEVIATCPPASVSLGTRIRVEIHTRFIPWFMNWGTLPLRARAERTILNAIPIDAPPGVPTALPTPTPTPTAAPASSPPAIPPPLSPSVTASPVGNSGKCEISRFQWAYNPAWNLALQGYGVWYLLNGAVASQTMEVTTTFYYFYVTLNDGESITFEVWAIFANGAHSGVLDASYLCDNGTVKEASP